MIRCSRFFKVLLLLLVAVSAIPPMHAQETTGEITGLVTDSSGATIPNATITITNSDTKTVVRTLRTNSKGEYNAPLLQVGTYSITVIADRFGTQTIDDIELDVTASVRENFSMKPGEQATVTVSAASSLAPDMESGALGTTINGSEMQDLALNTRNFEQMVQLEPGVVFGGTSDQLYTGLVSPSGSRNSAALSINGLRQDQNANLLDGMDNLEHNTGTSAIIFPVIEAIDQLHVLRNSYNAQYGGGGNAQITVVTKAGGSVYHGDVHLFVRNAIFNARNYFANGTNFSSQKPEDNQYTGGFTVGGPVQIPHLLSKEKANTFFFYALEIKSDQVQGVDNINTLPNPLWYLGIFDEAVCDAYTPGTHTCVGNKLPAGTPLPQNLYNPVSLEYLKDVFPYFPGYVANSANAAATIGKVSDFIDAPNTHDEYEQFARLDRAFGPRLNTFFRYVHDPVDISTYNALYANSYQQFAPSGIPGVSDTAAQTTSDAFLLHGTYALTNSTVVDLSLSYTQFQIHAQPTGAFAEKNSPDVQFNSLPFPTTSGRLPTLTISPATYGSAGPKNDYNHMYQVSSNIFKTLGRHSLSFGVNYEMYQETVNSGTITSGQFRFTDVGDFEQAFADFLVGDPAQFIQTAFDPVSDAHINMFEGYVQDDWKILPRLTLNLGTRYSFFKQPTEAYNHIGSFEPSFYNPLHAPTINGGTPTTANAALPNQPGTICLIAPCTGGGAPNPNYDPLNGIVQGGVNSPYGGAVSNQPTLNFAPRFGFAMDVYGDGKTALKGGVGYFFDQTQLNVVHNAVFSNPAYVQTLLIANPSFQDPAGSVNPASPVPAPAYGVAGHWKTPYTIGYSLEVQQQFSNEQILDIAYSGNLSKHLPGQIDINQPYQDEYLTAGLPYPGGASQLAALNLQALDQIRPFLGYDAIVSENPVFYGNYNSLQTSYNRRIGGSSRLSLNYTWSKALADSLGATTQDGQPSGAPQNSYCLSCEYGPVNFDRRHVFTTHYVYYLPYARRAQHGFMQHLLGGFEVAGIVTAAGGLQLTAKAQNSDPAGVGITSISSPETERPNYVSDPNQHVPHTINCWIANGSGGCPAGTPIAFAFAPNGGPSGSAHVGTIRGPGYLVFNLSVFKNVTIKDAQTLQFRVEAFNALNHPNWSSIGVQAPGATFAGNFGTVTGARDPREMELGIKYVF